MQIIMPKPENEAFAFRTRPGYFKWIYSKRNVAVIDGKTIIIHLN